MKRCCLLVSTLVALCALTGCGNEQKGSMLLMLDAVGRHPELMDAAQTYELAQLLASMNLTSAQAQALEQWATTDGKALRDELNAGLDKANGALAATRAASLAMVRQRAATYTERAAIAAAHKVPLDDPLQMQAAVPMPRPGAEEAAPELLTPARVDRLEPAVLTLRDEQRMAALGTWADAVKAVVEYQTVKAGRDAKRQELVQKVLECVGKDAGDAKLTEKLKKPLAAIPTGLTTPRNPEDDLRALLDALPPAKPADQLKPTARALAAMLSLAPAATLLHELR